METVANCAQHGEITWPAAVALVGMFAAVAAIAWALVYGAINDKRRSGNPERDTSNFWDSDSSL